MAKNWWGTRRTVSPLLHREVEMMQYAFGDTFHLSEQKRPQQLYWIGTIEINLKGLKHRDHVLKIVYPQEYPNRPPEAYIVSPEVYSPKHQFEDGQLCLFNPKDGITYGWNPSSSTAVTVAGWAIEWIYAFYTWRATGRWPGIEERLTKDSFGWLRRR